MTEIIGISCVYGVPVSYTELILILNLDLELDLKLTLTLKAVSKYLPSGLELFSNREWEDDRLILGINLITLDVDPSREGSTMAPVITLPDITDFSFFTDEKPMYYQIAIYE